MYVRPCRLFDGELLLSSTFRVYIVEVTTVIDRHQKCQMNTYYTCEKNIGIACLKRVGG